MFITVQFEYRERERERKYFIDSLYRNIFLFGFLAKICTDRLFNTIRVMHTQWYQSKLNYLHLGFCFFFFLNKIIDNTNI